MHSSLARWKLRGGVALAAVLTAAIFAPVFVNAQSRSEAQLQVQIQELQDQVRSLTGQVEGLQFSIGQSYEQERNVGRISGLEIHLSPSNIAAHRDILTFACREELLAAA